MELRHLMPLWHTCKYQEPDAKYQTIFKLKISNLVLKLMHSQLTNPEYLESFLQKHSITPTRSAGQNFLVCAEPLEAMMAAMEGAGEVVTELGAGLGTATSALVHSGYNVRAIERDETLAKLLPKELPPALRDKVDLQIADLREVPWEWDQPWQLVGNIPYNLSGYIFRRLTELQKPPTQALFLVQREVAKRLAAMVPDMNLLGLAAQLWGTVHVLLNVPASCFVPPPEVESSLVLLIPHGSAGLPLTQQAAVLNVAKPFFQQKRKQMGGVLRREFNMPPEKVEGILSAVGISSMSRPQEVSVEQWRQLSEQLTHDN